MLVAIRSVLIVKRLVNLLKRCPKSIGSASMDVISFMIAVVIVGVVVRQRSRNALIVVRNVMPIIRAYVTYSKLSQNLHVVHRKNGTKVNCIVFFTTKEKWKVNVI